VNIITLDAGLAKVLGLLAAIGTVAGFILLLSKL
jgi:hypothetical protein